jgi:hypothetical protein
MHPFFSFSTEKVQLQQESDDKTPKYRASELPKFPFENLELDFIN